jgi:hypothetical protein
LKGAIGVERSRTAVKDFPGIGSAGPGPTPSESYSISSEQSKKSAHIPVKHAIAHALLVKHRQYDP